MQNSYFLGYKKGENDGINAGKKEGIELVFNSVSLYHELGKASLLTDVSSIALFENVIIPEYEAKLFRIRALVKQKSKSHKETISISF